MKIFISVDMEGMAGITSPSQEREETVSFRRALHNQVRWIIEGIQASEKNGEVEEITIADSHGSGMTWRSLPATTPAPERSAPIWITASMERSFHA